MKMLVAYDSAYGNTAQIADVLSASLGTYGDSTAKQIAAVAKSDMKDLDVLVIGSPTQGGRPTQAAQQFIDQLPPQVFTRTHLAVFDTRFDVSKQNIALRMLMKAIGYAAAKMAESIQRKGGSVISEPTGFIVIDKDGPIAEGELERVSRWATQLALINS